MKFGSNQIVTSPPMYFAVLIARLLQKRRNPIEVVNFHNPYHWRQVDPDDILHPQIDQIPGGVPLLNMHCGIALEAEPQPVAGLSSLNANASQLNRDQKLNHQRWLEQKASRYDQSKLLFMLILMSLKYLPFCNL